MPEQIRCPSCDATLRVPENLLGKNVKCPKCQQTFLAELDAPAEPEVAPPSTGRRRPSLPEDEEGIADEPIPKSRRRPAPADEDEEELPPEDEDEDRPRRRKRRRRGSSEAASAVTGPAISLMVTSGLSIAVSIVDLIFRIVGVGLIAGASGQRGVSSSYAAGQSVGVAVGGGFDILSIILAIVIIVGAVKMKNLQSYGLALTSCILAMLPIHCCCVLGLPFGIWGVVMLNKPEVKDAFS